MPGMKTHFNFFNFRQGWPFVVLPPKARCTRYVQACSGAWASPLPAWKWEGIIQIINAFNASNQIYLQNTFESHHINRSQKKISETISINLPESVDDCSFSPTLACSLEPRWSCSFTFSPLCLGWNCEFSHGPGVNFLSRTIQHNPFHLLEFSETSEYPLQDQTKPHKTKLRTRSNHNLNIISRKLLAVAEVFGLKATVECSMSSANCCSLKDFSSLPPQLFETIQRRLDQTSSCPCGSMSHHRRLGRSPLWENGRGVLSSNYWVGRGWGR